MNNEWLNNKIDSVATLPYHQYLGVKNILCNKGNATFEIEVNENTANPSKVLHGGVIYTLADVVSYLALMSDAEYGEDAVTHDLHVSVYRPAAVGTTVLFSSEIDKKGRNVAFLKTKVFSNDVLIASATVTKSIIRTV